MPEPVRLMLAADRNVLRWVPTVLNSVRHSTPGALEVVLVVDAVREEDERELRRVLPRLDIRLMPIDGGRVRGLGTLAHISTISYARLLMPEMVDWPRFVYLDVDVVVERDLGELQATDLAGAHYAGVHYAGELNAGVLVIDAERWRREGLATRTLAWAAETRPKMMEQAAIAHVLGDSVRELDERWNCIVDPLWGRVRMRNTAGVEPYITHYITCFKPWNRGRWLMPRAVRERWDRYRVPNRLPRNRLHDLKILAVQARLVARHGRLLLK